MDLSSRPAAIFIDADWRSVSAAFKTVVSVINGDHFGSLPARYKPHYMARRDASRVSHSALRSDAPAQKPYEQLYVGATCP